MAHSVTFMARVPGRKSKVRISFRAKGAAPRKKHGDKPIGFCKKIYNPKTKLSAEVCKVKNSGRRQWKIKRVSRRKGRR